MRPEFSNDFHFFDDDMAQYSISSLLGDSIDTIKKAEFRQRTASSAAKIKEIVSEIREDVTVMEERRKSRETTPIQPKLFIPADVRPDPAKQHEQAMRNRELMRIHSPAIKFKERLELDRKKHKPIAKRKFSIVHSLPERAKKEALHYSASTSYSMNRLLSATPQPQYYQRSYTAIPTSLPYSTVPTSVPYSPLQYTPVSTSLPASPTTPSAFNPIVHH